MTKQLILTFAVFCTLQARANVQPVQEDTVRHYSRYEATELLQFMQPAYLDGVVLPMSRTGNWFVSIAGGMTAFLGTPLGCEDLFGRVKPSYSLCRYTYQLQRITVQGCRTVLAGLPLYPRGFALEHPRSRVHPAETGTLGTCALCRSRAAA